tara:strand:- start:5152 stop:5331 length:180 start_codon:yes stop_codon:yes gene_type:complete
MGKFKKRHNGITQTSEPHPFDSSRQNIGFANIKKPRQKCGGFILFLRNWWLLKSRLKLL